MIMMHLPAGGATGLAEVGVLLRALCLEGFP